MELLEGNQIRLRAIEPEDLDFLYEIENNELFWEVSHTQTPFSRFLLKQYIENCHLDIYEARQLRLLIETKDSTQSVGLIDIFDFNPQHKRAGVGIVIHEKYQSKGYASEALELLIKYSFTNLQLHQLFANIAKDNQKSISLFKKHHFKMVGSKSDWLFINGTFKDEILFQLINEK
jgi:diamine N-acetyltransferase